MNNTLNIESEFQLNDLHIEYLKGLRRNKLYWLFGSYGLFILLFLTSIAYPLGRAILEFDAPGNNWISIHRFQIIGFALLAFMLYKIVGHFVLKSILPLNKDIKQRSGILEQHQIIRKEYFPLSGHAYFFFVEIDIPNITVNESTYYSYEQGDFISIRKAKHSKIVFEDIDRQEINTSYKFEGHFDKWPFNQH